MIAFGILDLSTYDGEDYYGRPMDDLLILEVRRVTSEYGNLTVVPLEAHVCSDEDFEDLYEIEQTYKEQVARTR